MWCANCQADVAAEVSVDNQRIHCATCHSELEGISRRSAGPATRNAQEILARWSNTKLLDPFGPIPTAATETRPTVKERQIEPAEVLGTGQDREGRVYRFETAHEQETPQVSEASEPVQSSLNPPTPIEEEPRETRSTTSEPAPTSTPVEPRIHAPHAGVAAPHWSLDVQDEIVAAERKSRTNWSNALSQLLAYCGVGVLTIGTACVIWGYFGAVPSYLPLGWLTVTFGQMLLFLGLVTLVSNGIETLHSDMEARFDQLSRHDRREADARSERQETARNR